MNKTGWARRTALLIFLSAGTGHAAETAWNQAQECARGGCWQKGSTRDAVVIGRGGAQARPALAATGQGFKSRAASVPPPERSASGVGSGMKKGLAKAWGYVKDNWPGILGGIVGGVAGSLAFGFIGGIIGSVLGSLLGHFIAGLFGG